MTNGIRFAKTQVLLFAAVVLAAGCSKELPEPGTGMPGDGIIRLSATIADEASSSEGVLGDTKAPVIDGGAGAKAVLPDIRMIKKDGASMVTDFSGATTIPAQRDASGAITFSEEDAQYMKYNKMDTKAWVTAFSPYSGTGGAQVTMNDITWTINGKTDILLSSLDPTQSYDAGKYSAPVTGTLTLYHALAQLEVKIISADSQYPQTVRDTWGKITKIELLSSAQKMTYTYATNALTYDAAGALPLLGTDYDTAFAAVLISNVSISVAAGMFPPSTGPIRLKVYSEKVIGGVEVTVQLKDAANANTNFQAGKHYVVTLTFGANDKQIGVKSTVTAWTKGYSAENKPAWTPRIGSYHYTDGTISWDILPGKTIEGVIYWVDDADPFHFKIAALNEPPASWKTYGNDAGKLKWSDVATGMGSGLYASIVVANGSDGAGRLSGLANHKIIRKYCAENTSGHTLANFPAARWCEEMRVDGRGGWVLPSIDEVDYLYCAYSGNTPSKWLSGSGPAAQTGYPEAFDTRFTEAGGKNFTFLNNFYIASTLQGTTNYHYIHFGNQGLQALYGTLPSTAANVRCIKEFPVREEPPRQLPSDGVLDFTLGNTVTSGTFNETAFTAVSTTTSYNGYTYNASNANNNGEYKTATAGALAEPVYQKLEVAKANQTAPAGTAGWNADGTKAEWTAAWDACKAKAPAGAWRLPRASELAWMYLNKAELNKTPGFTAFVNTDYWSSTEGNDLSSWFVRFPGYTSYYNKGNTSDVRCVREITLSL